MTVSESDLAAIDQGDLEGLVQAFEQFQMTPSKSLMQTISQRLLQLKEKLARPGSHRPERPLLRVCARVASLAPRSRS